MSCDGVNYGNQAIYNMQGTGRDINGYSQLMSAFIGTNNNGLAFQSGNACYTP